MPAVSFFPTAEADAAIGAARSASRGSRARVYYTPVLPQQPAMRAHRPTAPMTGAERYAKTTLALPIGQSLTAERIGAVVRAAGAGLA